MERYLSLKDHVYHYISERISSGELGAGDKINEQQIGEELNISRTPVREALIQLASDGYVDNFPRRGFYVKSLDIQKIQEFYEVIGILDGRAAVLCMEHLTNQDLEQMKLLANQMDRAIDEGHGDLYYELQVEFHDVYLRKCPNTEIFSLLKRLKDNFIRKYYLFEGPDNELEVLHDTNQQHYEIIRLFQEKKAAELECYIRDVHWDSKKAKFDILPSKQKKVGQSK